MDATHFLGRRCAWFGWFRCFLLVCCTGQSTWATITVDPPLPITHSVTVQIIETALDDGTEPATTFGNSSQRSNIEEQIDTIWSQAGIDVEFLPNIVRYNDTFAYQGNGGERPQNDLDLILANAANEGDILHPDSSVVNIFFVNVAAGFDFTGENFANGLANIGVNGITQFVGDNLLTFQNGRDVIAKVVAHEIAHNLGLKHPANGLPNLMSPGGSTEQLTTQQIDAIFQTSFRNDSVAFVPAGGTGFPQTLPTPPERIWQVDAPGQWTVAGNWSPDVVPNSADAIAIFGSAISSPRTVTVNANVTLKEMRCDNFYSYTLDGIYTIIMNADTDTAAISIDQATHILNAPVRLATDTNVNMAENSTLIVDKSLNLEGQTMMLSGPGHMVLNGDSSSTAGAMMTTSGQLSGTGTVGGHLQNNGAIVAPGNSTGTLKVAGNYQQSASSTLAIEIGGTTMIEQFDVLTVEGSASIAGNLDVSFLDVGGNPFVPGLGDRFLFLDTNLGVTGEFQTTAADLPPLGPGLGWNINYGSYDVGLEVVSVGVPGDYNGDLRVNAADYTRWRDSLGETGPQLPADGNGDGVIDTADYHFWRAQVGTSADGGTGSQLWENGISRAGNPVPEPAAWLLACGGAIGAWCSRESARQCLR